MNKLDLEPHQLVLDCVLRYSPTMPKMGEAAVLQGNLILLTRNHRGQPVSFTIPVNFEGEPADGEQPRFVLYRIDRTVWKLTPSLLHEMLHCYITIVQVPEDVGWA